MSKTQEVFVVQFYNTATDNTSWIMERIRANLLQESKADIEYISRLSSPEEVVENLYYATTTMVCKIDNDIVGFATLDAYNCIKNLYVFSKYRRNGYGKKLAETIIENATTRYQTKCYAKIRKTNIPSLRLFESLGFSSTACSDNVFTYEKSIGDNTLYYVACSVVMKVRRYVKQLFGKLL